MNKEIPILVFILFLGFGNFFYMMFVTPQITNGEEKLYLRDFAMPFFSIFIILTFIWWRLVKLKQ